MADDEVTIVSTDEAILDAMGEGDEQATEEGSSEQDSGTGTETTEEASPAGGEQGVAGSGDPNDAGSPRGPQDLVGRDGQVIAAGGKERRFYETAQREKTRADTVTQENETLKAQIEAINTAGNVGTQYALTPEEVTTGAQIIAAYKEDPVGTLNYMLTQAQASGHNVDQLVNGGTDMGAIRQLIQNELAPITQEHKQRADTQAAEENATNIYNGFIGQHPDAAIHENALARLLQTDNSLTVDSAYYKLQNYYLQNGLDWTKPLEVLQQENQASQAPSVVTPPQPPEGGIPVANVTDTSQVADVSTSTSDIIKQAMAENGINF